ncbi:MAG TPA: hypothetical protein ENF93_00790 [Ignisphaera sp.]|nr:hypothetical protein [Ignisphaera sp.]
MDVSDCARAFGVSREDVIRTLRKLEQRGLIRIIT